MEQDHVYDNDNEHDDNLKHNENVSIDSDEEMIEERWQDHNTYVLEIDTWQNTEEPSVASRRSGQIRKNTTAYTPSFIIK